MREFCILRRLCLLVYVVLVIISGYNVDSAFPNFPIAPVHPVEPLPIKYIGNTAQQLKFAEDAVRSHNKFREFHNVPPMILDPQLCLDSLKWAKNVADECDRSNKFVLRHSKLPDRGENIYACKGHDHWSRWMGTNATHTRASEAVASWYSEINNYNYSTPKYQWRAGHFTQLVWKDSIHMGMAWATGPQGTIAVVAQYTPFGNIVDIPGEFERNVLPLAHAAKKKQKLATSKPDHFPQFPRILRHGFPGF